MAEKSRVTTPRGRHESLVPGVSSSRLRPDSDQSRIWCRARPWLVCDSMNELTWVSFVVHWHLTIFFFFFFFCRFVRVVWQDSDSTECDTGTWYSGRSSMLSSDSWLIDIAANEATQTRCIAVRCSSATSKTGNRFGWSFFFAVWRRCARSQLHMNSVVLVESQGSCALARIVRLQKFDRRDNMIFTVHLNRLIDENTPLEQSTIKTCLQEVYK